MLINRLDSLCTLVLTGQWPSGRRYVSEAHVNQSGELQGDEMAYARAGRKAIGVPGEGEDGEFTVKLLKVFAHQTFRILLCVSSWSNTVC